MKCQIHFSEGTTTQNPSNLIVEQSGCIPERHIRWLGQLLSLEENPDVSLDVPDVFGIGALPFDLFFIFGQLL